LAGVAAGLASAAPPSSIVEPVGEARDAASFTFRVNTPALLLSNLPDGSSQIQIEGFAGTESRPGVPDLPFSVVRIAIPAGVTPRLVLGNVVEDRMPGVFPRPVAKNIATLSPDATDVAEGGVETRVRREKILEPDSAFFKGRDPYPRSVVSLGEIGTFRDQRYVEVRIAPVRFDPTLRGLRVARALTVTIAFDGDTGVRSISAPDPRIEDLYRDMFANYGQGTTFRLEPAPQSVSAVTSPLVGPLYRLRVRANGIVRLDLSRLTGTGFESQPLSTYKLMNRGVEVPLLVFDANTNDQLNAGDWVQFYGQALDDEPKTVVNTVIPGGANIYELRDYSDENVYFLTAEPGARSRLATRSAPPNLTTPAAKFDAVAHVETDNIFRPLGGADPWYNATMLGITPQGNPGGGGVLNLTPPVPLPGLASGTDPAHVVVRLRGRTEDPNLLSDHKSRITLLNASAQPLNPPNNDDGTFDGRTIYTHDFTWTFPGSGAVLTSPAQVKIEALAVPASAVNNEFFLDFVEVGYKRTFQASGDVLTFDYPDGDAEFQVTGLTTNLPEVWELTGRVGTSGVVAPVRVTGGTIGGSAGNFSVRFHMNEDPAIPNGTPRRFVVASTNGVTIPASADFTPDTVSDLRNTANQADLIVIAHPTALGPTATTTLNSLLAWKLANQGITSKIAMIQDVYDEFGDGLESPQAIKNFLAFTLSTNPGEGWSGRKPAWVLLIGDGSYDPKHNDTFWPTSNFLPTQILFKDDPSFGFYASDSILANVAGSDSIADLVVGRVPTRTDGQTETVLHKLLDYEQNPPAGNGRRHAIFVSDRGKSYNALEAKQWEDTNTAARNWLKIPPNTQRTMRYWSDPEYCDGQESNCTPSAREALRADIKLAVRGLDGVSNGTSIMQYTGHGNFTVWSDDFFFAHGYQSFLDVNALDNGVKLPWLIVHNCLTGGFMDANDITQGEAWLKKAGGGAMAVFSPSGLNDSYSGIDITNKLWGTLFGPTKDRVLGNAVASAMNYICGLGVTQTCQQYVLMGDPTTRMVFTTVQPPSALTATAGNSVVNLSWTASPQGGVTYGIYRAMTSPSFGYTPVGTSGTTSFSDTTAVNTKTYFYYVVALDGELFESRWSNFNSDCGVSGPDCVTATPLNPNPPPAPTGLVVTDPETGGKLVLSWNANATTDEIDHYTVWWGTTTAGDYSFSASAAKQTTFTLSGLNDGSTYHVALTATNTSGHTSTFSPDVTGSPHFVRGVRSPQFVTSLKINKSVSGTDAMLTWTPVTVDIYNKTATIVSYEVFRGTTPIFVPGPGNKIGQPTTASFTDFGALAFANPNYHYLVRAVDANGNVGGAGNQLPDGIDILTMSKTPDGLGGYTLGLSWPAVTTDFDDRPLVIDHYEVYAKNVPFTWTDISGLVPIASPSTASSSVTAPVASQYYSVIAVDAHGNKSPF
jgi:hypothetical protein